ncbi:hypothetical protein [Candidatus Harpocratesius sp.]
MAVITKHRIYFCILLFSLLSFTSIHAKMNIVSATTSTNSSESLYTHSEIFRMEQGSSKFYLTTLNPNETWSLNLTALFTGVFYIFIFDERPTNDYIYANYSLDPEIYEQSIAYNNTPRYIFYPELNLSVANVQLDYKYLDTKSRLVYLEIVILENGPDTYHLYSSHLLEPYYIPFIDGFNPSSLIFLFLFSHSVIFVFINKKKAKNA